MKILPKKILAVVAAVPEPVQFRELMGAFGISRAERHYLATLVDGLVQEGELVKLKGNRYALGERLVSATGRLTIHRDGYGFLAPEEGGEDLYIPARYLAESMQGDRVEVRELPPRRDGKREGRIIRTLERGVQRVVGTFRELRQGGWLPRPSALAASC